MQNPYTIKLFVPEGEPNEFKIIDKMNWTGTGLEVSRSSWSKYKNREEFQEAGIYILFGYKEENDLPTIYIGQGDGVKGRIDSHEKNKDFWDKAIVFVSSNRGLNRAHITWIEWALIQKAQLANRCLLDNSAIPNEPNLTESDKADTKEFLNEILSILPVVDIRVFEKAQLIEVKPSSTNIKKGVKDTIVVPAQEKGFKEVFIGENSWYAIRVGGGKLKDIKHIAAYQIAPISAITHIADVASIEPYGDDGKYKLNFAGPAKAISPIKLGKDKSCVPQSSRYTNYEELLKAKYLKDLFD